MISRMAALNLLKWGAPVLLIGGVFYITYAKGVRSGKETVQTAWDQDVKQHEKQVQLLKEQVARNEGKHRTASQQIADSLAASTLNHTRALAALQSGFSERLRQSDSRSAVYERMSEAGAVERANLASHAAQLDRSLEEGRLLVGELRSTVEQRDEQIRALGSQIAADRQLIGSATVAPPE